MSKTSQGHGWWLASDGKWYPPEAWTGPPAQTAQTPYTVAEYPVGYQSSAPVVGHPPRYPSTGDPSAAYPSAGSPSQGASWTSPPRTNGLAVASLVCACAGIIPFLFGLPCLLGIIFGFVARSQIKNARGAQGGGGLALAGIIVGFSVITLFILAVVAIAAFDSTTHGASVPAV
jgi:hypothetical protein